MNPSAPPEPLTERLARVERELALYQTAFNEIPDAILLKDADGRFLLCNQALARLYNTTPEAMKGKHDGDFGVPAEMAERFRRNEQEIMARGQTETAFEDNRDPVSGETRHFKSIKHPFKDADGSQQILIIAHDITDVVLAQQRVVESEARLRDVMAATQEGIWDWQVKTGKVVHNAEWYRMLGFAEGEISDNIDAYSAQIHPEDRAGVWASLQALIDGTTDVYRSEHRMRCKDGSLIWVHDRGRIAEYDANDQVLRVVGSVQVVTERVEAKNRIVALMAQLDLIQALSPDGIAYFDASGKITFTNPAFAQLTGIDNATGTTWDGLMARLAEQADPKQLFPDMQPAGANDTPTSPLLFLAKPDRRTLQISAHSHDEGKIRIIYMRDVTRETDVDRMKSDFLSTAAHELRTPMTSILGFIELLRLREFDREKTKLMLDTIHRQTQRLTGLINELLDLARIEARGGKIFELRPVALEEIIRDSVNAMSVDDLGTQLKLDLPGGLPLIAADPPKLQQALLNILSNARKYSPDGGDIEVSIRYRQHKKHEQIGIVVRDHGIGMSSNDLARVFERFFRADRSCNLPGTGLGMALAKEVVSAHGGQIELESELGLGTTVMLWLPLPNPPLDTRAAQSASYA